MSKKVTLGQLLNLFPAYDDYRNIEIKIEYGDVVFDGKVKDIPYKGIKEFEDYIVFEITSGTLSILISKPDGEVEND